MFSKWMRFLLQFYDICGFCTETSINTSRKNTIMLFVFHILWTCLCSYFNIKFSMQPSVYRDILPFSINFCVHHVSGIFTYWMIIIESYSNRPAQRRFWQIYERINMHYRGGRSKSFRRYSIKLIEYFSVSATVQIFFMQYYMQCVQSLFFFRLFYLVSVTVCQYRAFYFLLYLDMMKYEMEAIKSETKCAATLSRSNGTFIQSTEEGANHRSNSAITLENVIEYNLKRINGYYQLAYELSECINQIFGWSNFTTVLYCFHLPLTEANWALWAISFRPSGYRISIYLYLVFLTDKKCIYIHCVCMVVTLFMNFSLRHMDDSFNCYDILSFPRRY